MSCDVHLRFGYFQYLSFLFLFIPSPACGLFYSSLTSTLMQPRAYLEDKCVHTNTHFSLFSFCLSLKRRTRLYSNSLYGFGSLNVPVTFDSITTFLLRWRLMQSLYRALSESSFFFLIWLCPIFSSFKSFSTIPTQIDSMLWGGENHN